MGKPRKERSDKGRSRGNKRFAVNAEDESVRPLKRARMSRTAPKSSEFVSSSDEGEDGDEDE